jgi:Bacterial SH3 domain/Outer membrane protein beta-barrel domain
MRTKAPLVVFLVLVLGAAVAASAQVAPARTMKIKVTAEQANLREKPDIGSGIVQQIPEGTVLEADRKEGEWFFVRYTLEDGGVIGGWIHESLVEIVEGAVPQVETKPAEKPAERAVPPRERRPGPIRIGRIERPEFRTGTFPLEAAFSLGVATVAPRDLNDGARGFADAYGALIGIPAPKAADALHIAFLTGVELNYRVSPKLAIGLAADFLKGANRDATEYSNETTTETVTTRPAARAVPVKLIARFYPAAGVYVRGGIGFYAAKVSYLYRIVRPDSWQQWKGTATDSALGAEVAFGGEWEAVPRTTLFIEAGFRYARFTDLTGKDVYTNSPGANVTTVGTLYAWKQLAKDDNIYPRVFVEETLPAGTDISEARAAVINLSGAAIRAGVRYRF